MHSIPKPIPHQGHRNTFCPHYGSCLDFVLGCSWEAWNCSQCPCKEKRPPVTEYIDVSADPEPCYELPPDIASQFGGNSLDWE
jgi:hypothetical protein